MRSRLSNPRDAWALTLARLGSWPLPRPRDQALAGVRRRRHRSHRRGDGPTGRSTGSRRGQRRGAATVLRLSDPRRSFRPSRDRDEVVGRHSRPEHGARGNPSASAVDARYLEQPAPLHAGSQPGGSAHAYVPQLFRWTPGLQDAGHQVVETPMLRTGDGYVLDLERSSSATRSTPRCDTASHSPPTRRSMSAPDTTR